MSTEQKKKLEQQLWNIADTLRGKMDADDITWNSTIFCPVLGSICGCRVLNLRMLKHD